MVRRKCVLCGSEDRVYLWPKNNPAIANKWTAFVQDVNPELKLSKKSCGICYKHFSRNSFKNFEAVFSFVGKDDCKRLRIDDHAVPTNASCSETYDIAANAACSKMDGIAPHRPSQRNKKRRLEDHFSPSKRRRAVEVQTVSSESDDEDICHMGDKDYDFEKSFNDYYEKDCHDNIQFDEMLSPELQQCHNKPWLEEKFIVPWSFLYWALANCRHCGEKENVVVDKSVHGAALVAIINCNKCGKSYSKATSEKRNRIFELNYVISCAVLFGGAIIAKTFRIFELAGIRVPIKRTFFAHQRDYLNKAVADVWLEDQKSQVHDIKKNGKAISLAGDARCDSAGHSAKYACYSMLNLESGKIISTQQVQTKGNSNAMELTGLKLCLNDVLRKWKVKVKSFVSDRHVQIRKYMRETYGKERKDKRNPLIHHFLDIWHVAKALRKELTAKAQSDPSGLVERWITGIVNHMYWVACSTPNQKDRAEILEAKWLSLTNHVVNKHAHKSPLYPKCEHSRKKKGIKRKKYMKQNTPEHEIICDVVDNVRRRKDVRQLSSEGQTSSLEAFHSALNHFAPKYVHFHYRSMFTRIKLAALHFNHNSRRRFGPKKLAITYPKFKKGVPTVRSLPKGCSFEYVQKLMERAFLFKKDGGTDVIPPPVTELFAKPTLDEQKHMKDQYTSRFNNTV